MCLKMNRGIFVTENSINVAMLSTYIIYSSLDFLNDLSWGSSAWAKLPLYVLNSTQCTHTLSWTFSPIMTSKGMKSLSILILELSSL